MGSDRGALGFGKGKSRPTVVVEAEMSEVLSWKYYVGYLCLFLPCGNRSFTL